MKNTALTEQLQRMKAISKKLMNEYHDHEDDGGSFSDQDDLDSMDVDNYSNDQQRKDDVEIVQSETGNWICYVNGEVDPTATTIGSEKMGMEPYRYDTRNRIQTNMGENQWITFYGPQGAKVENNKPSYGNETFTPNQF